MYKTMLTTQERELSIENTRSIIHRTTYQTRKWKQRSMERLIASEGFIFCTTGRFITNQIRICTAQSSRANSLVCIHHNFMIRSFLHRIQIMIIQPLTVVVFTTWDDIANISTLHRIVTVIFHKLISFIHMTFIVTHRCRSLMMHHQLHSFTSSILIQHFHIKIRIRSNEVEHIVF